MLVGDSVREAGAGWCAAARPVRGLMWLAYRKCDAHVLRCSRAARASRRPSRRSPPCRMRMRSEWVRADHVTWSAGRGLSCRGLGHTPGAGMARNADVDSARLELMVKAARHIVRGTSHVFRNGRKGLTTQCSGLAIKSGGVDRVGSRAADCYR